MITDETMTILRDMAVRHNISLEHVISEYAECEIEDDPAETLWYLEMALGLYQRASYIHSCIERHDIDAYNNIISQIGDVADRLFRKGEAIR